MGKIIGRAIWAGCGLAVAFSCSSPAHQFSTKGAAGAGASGDANAAGETGTGGGTGGQGAGSGGSADTISGAAGEGGQTPSTFHSLALLAGRIVVNSPGASASLSTPSLLALDGKGNLYVGEANAQRGLRKVDLSSYTLSTTDWATGVIGATAADDQGDLFIACADEVLRRVSSTGTVSDVAGLANATGTTDGIAAAARFNFVGDGHIVHVGMTLAFGDLFIADTGNHAIRRVVIATGEVTTVAGTPGTPGITDGVKTAAQFSSPTAMTLAGNGNLFIADYDNKTIRSLETSQGTVATIAGTAGMSGSTNGVGSAARFANLSGLAGDLGSLFVGDGPSIRRITLDGQYTVTTLAGLSSGSVGGAVDGRLADARFGYVADLAFDRSGNLLIADSGSGLIRQVGPLRTDVQTVVGHPPTLGSADGAAANARFYMPAGVVADDAGNVFVADVRNETIREISAGGQVTTLAGSPGVTGKVDGTGAAASFWLQAYGAYASAGLVLDGKGNLFVTDSLNQVVRQLEIATGNVTTAAGSPRMPSGIVLDGGDLFVVDEQTSQIGRLSLVSGSWAVSTLAGSAIGSSDGIGTDAEFSLACNGFGGIASDGHGTLFVSDCRNHTIRQIVEATREVTTLAGTAGMNASDDGVGPDAHFNFPMGIAADGNGSLYIADSGNSTLRKLVLATREVTTVVGVPGQPGIALGPLPASLSMPTGVAMLKDGGIVISDSLENAILVVR